MNRHVSRKKDQFELERRLHRRIMHSSRADRAAVTASAYDELLSTFPDHSVFVNDQTRVAIGKRNAAMFAPLVKPGARILEVGCGRGDVIAALANAGHSCTGIEPSKQMIDLCATSNALRIQFGVADKLEFPDDSFELVFSQQVLEHIHPDDVPLHFAESMRVLSPGGVLAIETPNRRTGPQDISRGFVREAEGLHLKEWGIGELIRQFHNAAFKSLRGVLLPPVLARRSSLLHRWSWVPAWVKLIPDAVLLGVPGLELRTNVGKALGVEDVFLFGRKHTNGRRK